MLVLSANLRHAQALCACFLLTHLAPLVCLLHLHMAERRESRGMHDEVVAHPPGCHKELAVPADGRSRRSQECAR